MTAEEYFEMTPVEEEKFDYLVDVRNRVPADARAEILANREKNPATLAVSELVTVVTDTPESSHPHYSRRGGRSFPEAHDWEIERRQDEAIPSEPLSEEQIANAEQFINEGRQAAYEAKKAGWIANGMSETEANARIMAKEQKRLQQD